MKDRTTLALLTHVLTRKKLPNFSLSGFAQIFRRDEYLCKAYYHINPALVEDGTHRRSENPDEDLAA